MNDLTGFNPEEASANIHDFSGKMMDAIFTLNRAFEALATDLAAVWASPNAVTFANEQNPKVDQLFCTAWNKKNEICANAVRAYNIVASQHGAERINDSFSLNPVTNYGGFTESGAVFQLKPASDRGIVGMNINMVKNWLIPAFQDAVNNAIAEFDALPSGIALYDPGAGQQNAYKQSIEKVKSDITSLTEAIVVDIIAKSETEVDNALLAVQNSTSTLSA